MGRKKFIGKRFWVMSHPKIIKQARKDIQELSILEYAKEKSEEYVKNTTTVIDRTSEATGNS